MKLSVNYAEIITLAEEKTGKEITLTTLNDKTVRVGYVMKMKVPFMNKYLSTTFDIDVTYEKLVGEDVYLSYNGGKGLDMAIEGVKNLVPQLKDIEIIELASGNNVIVHLGKIENAHEALEKIIVNDVMLNSEGVFVEFSLK